MKDQANNVARVLVVDDEPLALWLAKRCLEGAGCFVSESGSCQAAEELLLSMHFDMVVLDYRLGDGTGLDILRRLRGRNDGASAVLLTAEAENISEQERRELKVDAVISKPLDVDELRRVMEPLLKAIAGQGVDAAVKAGEARTHIGRFTVVSLPAEVSVLSFQHITEEADDNPWLALDMRRSAWITDDVQGELARLALKCREGRGRLCVILDDEILRQQLKAQGTDKELDVLATLEELDPASRRLSAGCERSAILDVAVKRNPAP